MVEASQQNVGNEIKPFRTQIGDIIFGGFLVRKDALNFKVNSQKLLARNGLLKYYFFDCKVRRS